jgi:uncharacterized membrane protein YgcG
MITQIIQKTMFTVLVELVVRVPRELPSLSSPLTVSHCSQLALDIVFHLLTLLLDAKQARDLVTILNEAKQQIDPRLAEMARYGGGGGGGGGGGSSRWGGGGRGRGRGGFTQANNAPLGNNRRW